MQSFEIGVYFRRTRGYWEVLQEEEAAFWAIGRQLQTYTLVLTDQLTTDRDLLSVSVESEGETQPGIIMSDCYSMQHQSLPPDRRGAGLSFRHGRVLRRHL